MLNHSLSTLLSAELTAISIPQLMAALGLAFLLSLYVVFIYKLVYTGVLFSGRFALSLILLTMITAVVILTISSNVVLSLGMVGALSIVRFRTAVKDVMDTVFMFWAIVVGIVCGAGFMLVSVIATLVIGVVILGVFFFTRRINAENYLVVVRADASADLQEILSKLPKYRVKSQNCTDREQEIVVEVKLSKKQSLSVKNLLEQEGVRAVNTVSYRSQTIL